MISRASASSVDLGNVFIVNPLAVNGCPPVQYIREDYALARGTARNRKGKFQAMRIPCEFVTLLRKWG